MLRRARLLFCLLLVVSLASCNMPRPVPRQPTAPADAQRTPAAPSATAGVTPEPGLLPEPVTALTATLALTSTTPGATLMAPTDWPPLATLRANPPDELVEARAGQGAPLQFWVQPGAPAATTNFAHPELGCNWMGVAGQAFLGNGEPAPGLVVEVTGSILGQSVYLLALTGGAPVYGPGGFELRLADRPALIIEGLRLRLLDLQGRQLTSPIALRTSGKCEENLLLINFLERPAGMVDFYLPLVHRLEAGEVFLPNIQAAP